MSDATTDLLRALAAQERAEERLAKAAHALAEAEERAEDDPAAAALMERCRVFNEAAQRAAEIARARRRKLEARLDPGEVVRAYALLAGGRRG